MLYICAWREITEHKAILPGGRTSFLAVGGVDSARHSLASSGSYDLITNIWLASADMVVAGDSFRMVRPLCGYVWQPAGQG